MSAKDYEVCCALFEAYIAKRSKKNPNLITDDRRAIPENEILRLIDWYVDRKAKDANDSISFLSHVKTGYEVVILYQPVEREKRGGGR